MVWLFRHGSLRQRDSTGEQAIRLSRERNRYSLALRFACFILRSQRFIVNFCAPRSGGRTCERNEIDPWPSRAASVGKSIPVWAATATVGDGSIVIDTQTLDASGNANSTIPAFAACFSHLLHFRLP